MGKKTLTIVGAGISGPNQLTLEALAVLQEVDLVLSFAHSEKRMKNFFDVHNISKVKYLDAFYENGKRDYDTYSILFNEILEATNTVANTALVMPGHPRLGVTLVQWLTAVEDNAITVKVIPGISRIATIINDLQIDPLEKGLSIIDANRLLLLEHHINTNTDHLIYHVCAIGTSNINTTEVSSFSRLDLLQEYLEGFYPKSHHVILVKSPCDIGGEVELVSRSVSNLSDMRQYLTMSSTLYIPGLKPKKYSESFYSLVAS